MEKDTTYTKIFVGGLPYHTNDASLRKYFESFGEIDEAVVITDKQTGKSRGYGFVSENETHVFCCQGRGRGGGVVSGNFVTPFLRSGTAVVGAPVGRTPGARTVDQCVINDLECLKWDPQTRERSAWTRSVQVHAVGHNVSLV